MDAAAPDSGPGEGGNRGRSRPYQTYGTVAWEPGKSRVEPETLTYLQEVSEHAASLEDDEERDLLLGNVLSELEGRELRIAADAVCSRLLETLLARAAPRHLITFMGAFTVEDAMYKLAGNAFGSHVAEGLLMRLGAAAAAGELEEGDAGELAALLDGLAGAVGDALYDYLMDRHATHVARALLRVAAGRDVVPATKQGAAKAQQQQQQQQQQQHGGAGGGPGGSKGGAPASSLAEKLAGSHSGGPPPPPAFPALLSRLARMLPIYDPPSMATLAKNPYSGPFLQGVLRAAAGDPALLALVLPPMLGVSAAAAADAQPGMALAGVSESHMGKLLRDDVYSRLLEVALAVAPPPLWDEFHARFLKGRLAALSSHHAANYVVQAALAGAAGRAQVQAMFDELRGLLPGLLAKRRGGVLAALLAACGRAGACQREACAALAEALGSLPQWQGREGAAHLAPALLSLDAPGSGDGAQAAGARLSTTGCALLAAILGLPKNASRDFAASVAALPPADALRAARDASGSRALEALLAGPAGADAKRALLGQLAGSWGAVALSAPGSFFVERAYAWADADLKEQIVAGVAAESAALAHARWGARLARALALDAYARSADEWRKRAASAAATVRAYEAAFGGGNGSGNGGGGGKDKKNKKKRKHKEEEEQQDDGDDDATEQQQRRRQQDGEQGLVKAKKEKKGKAQQAREEENGQQPPKQPSSADAILAVLGFGAEGGDGKKSKKHHKKDKT